jgi:hypothetical protein
MGSEMVVIPAKAGTHNHWRSAAQSCSASLRNNSLSARTTVELGAALALERN